MWVKEKQGDTIIFLLSDRQFLVRIPAHACNRS